VPRLRHQVGDFADQAGVPDPPLADVRLAVSEAVTNVVVHGYRNDPQPGTIEIVAAWSEEELRVTVCDTGEGCTPRLDSPGLGMGLPIISQVTDGFELRKREPRGTELRMCFRIPAAA
jgi:serine/threonine-protein kinase RsbW/stage II sporulation protein AB (anti-sigma F factor)